MDGLKEMHCTGWFAETGHSQDDRSPFLLCSAHKLNGCGAERAEYWGPVIDLQSVVCLLPFLIS